MLSVVNLKKIQAIVNKNKEKRMNNEFINEENQTLDTSEAGETSTEVDDAKIEELENTARYMQSEKDKAFAENNKLRKEIEDIKSYIVSSENKKNDNKIDISPDDFEPWESFTDPNSKSYKFRMQETANLVKNMVDNELQGVKQDQAVNQLESELRARGMDANQIDSFFKFANTPVSELGIDNVVKMYNAVNEASVVNEDANSNLETVRRIQQSPATAGILQGQQPQKKNSTDSAWDRIMASTGANNTLP